MSAADPPDVAAAPAAKNPPPPPVVVSPAQTTNWRQLAMAAAMTLLAMLVFTAILPRLREWHEAGAGLPPVVHALAEVVPVEPCMPVRYEDVQNGTALFGNVNLRDVRASLYHHLRGTGSDGISAQYLQRHRICYALINMIERPGDPPNLVEMFNMQVIGVSRNRVVRNNEKSLLCQKPFTVRRFQEALIEYMAPNGARIERHVTGVAAQTVQQVDDVQSGQGYCEDSNLEAKLQKIYRRLEQMDPLHVAVANGPSLKQLPART